MPDVPYASAAARNAPAILGVLRHEFRACSTVLEIGSGTGQHAIAFAGELNRLSWQPSDLEQNHAGIRQWIAEAGLPNVREPIVLDMLTATAQPGVYDGVYSSNTAHIMSYAAVCRMFDYVATALRAAGVFCLYGPFCRHGEFNTASNADFDASLRARNSQMGLRDLDDLNALARDGGLSMQRIYAMPTNNLAVIWMKGESDK